MRGRLRRRPLIVAAAFIGLTLTSTSCAAGNVTRLSSPPTTDPSLTLTIQHSPEGPILATGLGATLYDFVPDTPTHSACVNDGCVFQWPPLAAPSSVSVGHGVSASLIGTLKRNDGSRQLSYGGHPLYTYNLDVTPGMVTGQAIDQDSGLWYVLTPLGRELHTAFTVTN
jgi:predicted lipoprotein with Yx(FWY)xxD motif